MLRVAIRKVVTDAEDLPANVVPCLVRGAFHVARRHQRQRNTDAGGRSRAPQRDVAR
ncbi:hypothetical protein OM788_006581 [Streptomyces sp. KA12]|uniref:hypothetical protein n=1 Tax=Streptomyces sp. KA12 TaxID=2991730 RepID=UPI0023AECCCD|nr:hypothetical protein [Streptomyces sp. KA12]MDF0376583.1 hypothetical protein [Streptomyces sp. KA12]